MRAGLRWGDVRQCGGVALAKRATRRRQQDAIHPLGPGGRVFGQALKNGGVFAVDGQKCRPAVAHCLHEQPAPHDQRLFVRQQQPLARTRRCQTGRQARSAHNGRHDRIHIRVGRYYFKSILRLKDKRWKAI
ncbi:hypothetical protein D3C72_1869120 [compost metagenome]